MHKRGTYNLQNDDKNSYRSFICGLLVVLALCLALYLMMMLIRPNEENELKEIEVLEENEKSSKEKLTVVNVPHEKDKHFSTFQEQTTSSYGKNTGNTEHTTQKQATNRNRTKEEDRENDILYHEHNTTVTPKTSTEGYQPTSAQTTQVKTEEKTAIDQTTEESERTIGLSKTTVKEQTTPTQTTLRLTTEIERITDLLKITVKSQTTFTGTTPAQTTLIQTDSDQITEKSENETVNTWKHFDERETTTSATSESNINATKLPVFGNGNTDTTVSPISTDSNKSVFMTSTDSVNARTDQTIIHETPSAEVATKTTEEQATGDGRSSYVTPNSANESDNHTTPSTINSWIRGTQTESMESIFSENNMTTYKPFTLDLTTDDMTIDLGIDHELFHVDNESTTTENVKEIEKDSSTVVPTFKDSLLLTEIVTSTLSTNKSPSHLMTTVNESQTSLVTEAYSDSTILNTTEENIKTQSPLFKNNLLTTNAKFSDVTVTTLNTTEVNTIIPISFKNLITIEENEISSDPTLLTTNSETTDFTHLESSAQTSQRSTLYLNTTAKSQHTTQTLEDKNTFATTSRTKTYQVLLKSPVDKEPVCDSVICKKTTSKMLNLMNHGIDPCDNFYEFACGGQNNEEEFLKKANFDRLFGYVQTINNASQKYLQNFKDFYQNCVEYETDFSYFERIKLLDDVPNFNLTDLFAELILTQSMPFFDVGMEINHLQNYSIQITLPGQSYLRTGITGWSIFEKIKQECLNEKLYSLENTNIKLDKLNILFKQCQKKRFKNAAENFVHSMMKLFPNSDIYNEENLQKLLKFNDELRDSNDYSIQEKLVEKFDFAELGQIYKSVDWRVLFEKITDNIGFEYDYKVQVYFSIPLNDIFLKLQSYNESDVVNILWLFSKLQLYENVVIPREKENREMFCMDLSRELMPDIVSIIMYEIARSDKHHHMQNIKIGILFNTLKDNLRKSLENSHLSEPSKIFLEDKLNRLKLGLITTGNYNVTKKNYKSIDLSGDSYPEGVVKLLKNYRTIIYSLDGIKASAASLLTYFVEHFYSQPVSFNQSEFIVFHPAVFLKSPMDLPDYMRLSKIGLHLSREIAKHFYEAQEWQNDNYYISLKKRTNQLLIDVYAKDGYRFDEKYLNFVVNESSSVSIINEMMTDNTAFRLIYDSFSTLRNLIDLPWISQSYSAEKVFFISAAQEYCKKSTVLDFMDEIYETKHLPASLRIQNIISNSKEFSDVFVCPEGSTMKLDDSLIIQFPYGEVSIDYSSEDSSEYLSSLSYN